jgi:hypothetical protein
MAAAAETTEDVVAVNMEPSSLDVDEALLDENAGDLGRTPGTYPFIVYESKGGKMKKIYFLNFNHANN